MRTRIAITGAWILGTVVTSGLAWAAVSRVESGITARVDTVVSARDVDRALAPLAVSSTTELANPGTPTPTTIPSVATPGVASAPPTTVEPGAPSVATTTAAPPPTTVAGSPPTISVATTTPQPTTTASAPPPTVIPTVGGTIAVTCPTAGTIRLVYATPNAGYTFTPGEITSAHLHVRFNKGGQSISIEAECSGGRVETSFEDHD